MRVVCPYTRVRRPVRSALAAAWPSTEFIKVDQSDEAYYELLSDLWRWQEDFCIIEQDIVVHADVFKSFEACLNDFCSFPYPYLGGPGYVGLGCTRFRSEIMHAYPNAFTEIAEISYPTHTPKHWCTLDAALQRVLEGAVRCVHQPGVLHLSDMPTHGCHA